MLNDENVALDVAFISTATLLVTWIGAVEEWESKGVFDPVAAQNLLERARREKDAEMFKAVVLAVAFCFVVKDKKFIKALDLSLEKGVQSGTQNESNLGIQSS